MLEILQFIFSSFWVFIGFCLLLVCLSSILYHMCKLLLEHRPFTYAGLKRQVVKEIIFKDIVINDGFENKEDIIKKKINMVNDTIKTAKNK